MVETHTRILGIAPYDGMRTAMEQAAQAYPNVELEACDARRRGPRTVQSGISQNTDENENVKEV